MRLASDESPAALHLAVEAQATSLALDLLVGLADLQAQAGEAEQALEISVCVLNHSASTQEAKDRAEHVRAQLESQLPPQQIQALQARVQVQSLDVLVAELLDSSPAAPCKGVQPSQGAQGRGGTDITAVTPGEPEAAPPKPSPPPAPGALDDRC